MLLDDGERITLTIPWAAHDGYAQIKRWFEGGYVHYGDDPDRSRYSYELPSELGFNDADGSVTLIGCQTSGYQSQIFGAGRGVVTAQLAVLGARSLAWGKVNAVRTHVPEMAEWAQLSSMTRKRYDGKNGRATGFDLLLRSQPVVRLARPLNLSLRPAWRVQSGTNGEPHRVFDDLLIETEVRDARDWEQHLDLHRAVRDLLDISAWQAFGTASIKAKRIDSPLHAVSGEVLDSDHWLDVRTYAFRPRAAGPRKRRVQHLFYLADIRSRGVGRWLNLRKKFRRGILPIVSLHDLNGVFLETQLTQTALGLEAIGYELAQEQGLSARAANRLSFEERMSLLQDTLALNPVSDGWPSRAAEAYNGVKHANRTLPDANLMWRVQRENLLIFRLWIAERLGCPIGKLRDRLGTDPQKMQLLQFEQMNDL